MLSLQNSHPHSQQFNSLSLSWLEKMETKMWKDSTVTHLFDNVKHLFDHLIWIICCELTNNENALVHRLLTHQFDRLKMIFPIEVKMLIISISSWNRHWIASLVYQTNQWFDKIILIATGRSEPEVTDIVFYCSLLTWHWT